MKRALGFALLFALVGCAPTIAEQTKTERKTIMKAGLGQFVEVIQDGGWPSTGSAAYFFLPKKQPPDVQVINKQLGSIGMKLGAYYNDLDDTRTSIDSVTYKITTLSGEDTNLELRIDPKPDRAAPEFVIIDSINISNPDSTSPPFTIPEGLPHPDSKPDGYFKPD